MKPAASSNELTVDPERWLEEYGDWLFQFALARVDDSHAAEDLVQDTLVSAFRGYAGFDHRSTLKTWLTAILKRRIADYYQKRKRRPETRKSVREDDNDHFSFSVSHAKLFHPKISNRDFQTSLEREEFLQIVQSCIAKLPAHLRQAFVTRVTRDDETLEAIGTDLQLTKSNLAVRLYRSRLLIRECLERFWTN